MPQATVVCRSCGGPLRDLGPEKQGQALAADVLGDNSVYHVPSFHEVECLRCHKKDVVDFNYQP